MHKNDTFTRFCYCCMIIDLKPIYIERNFFIQFIIPYSQMGDITPRLLLLANGQLRLLPNPFEHWNLYIIFTLGWCLLLFHPYNLCVLLTVCEVCGGRFSAHSHTKHIHLLHGPKNQFGASRIGCDVLIVVECGLWTFCFRRQCETRTAGGGATTKQGWLLWRRLAIGAL